MSSDDFQIGELVQRAVEDQAGKKDGRLQRIPDNVSEIAPAALPGIFLQDVVGAARMHEHRHAELLQLGPERVKLRQRERLTLDVSTDGRTAMAELLDRVLDLRRRQLGKLQRGRSQSHKASRVLLAPSRKPLIRRVHDPVGQSAVFHRVPPIAIDAQHLDIDPTPVHLLDTFRV